MSKFAVYSDLHLHPWEYGSYQMREGGNSRLHEQGSFLFWLGKFCKDRSIKELFFCGDFFHTHGRVSTEALFLATRGVQYISAQGVSQFLLVGNHDISRNFKDKFPLEPNSLEEFSPFGNIVSSPIIGKHLTHPNITISMIPFTESRSLLAQNLELVRRVATIHPHYLFLHQGVAQVPMGSGHLIDEILTPEMIPDNIARAFTGHYHTHKDLGKLVIVGPPMQHTWADSEEEGGILVVDSETGEFTREKIFPNAKFINVEAGFITAIAKMGEDTDLQKLVRNNFIRINNITTSLEEAEEAKAALIELGAQVVELKFAEKTSNPLDKESSKVLSIEEILGEFEKGLSDRQRQIGEELRRGSYDIPSP